ncbi:MAG: hypothetical protein ACR2O3_05125 [Rhizobiaceae bacterium]
MKTLTKIVMAGMVLTAATGPTQVLANYPAGLDSWPTWPTHNTETENGYQKSLYPLTIEGKKIFVFPFYINKSNSEKDN